MIRHHPDDALLLSLAAASLARGPATVITVHAERCPRCRERLRELDVVGGALLEAADPAVLSPGALARTLERVDAPASGAETADAAPMSRAQARFRAGLPEGMAWPRCLRDSVPGGWRWLGPGMRWSRLRLRSDPAANVFLLRIAAGKSLPPHSHAGIELTQVLHGVFDDGRKRLDAGDFDETDGSIHHQPVVQPGGECICIASVEGRVVFDGAIARALGALVGM
jgi:putative transcriptional regulator